jgi:hypothetical protein
MRDCLGCAGNQIIRTPNLDSIAADGVLFTNAYSSTPSCTPARSAVLTGLSPWHHGMLGYGRIAEQYPFELPQAMREAGYYLFGIGKMHWYPQKAPRLSRLLVDGQDVRKRQTVAIIASGSGSRPRPQPGCDRHRLERLSANRTPRPSGCILPMDRRPGGRVHRATTAGAVPAESLVRPAAQPLRSAAAIPGHVQRRRHACAPYRRLGGRHASHESSPIEPWHGGLGVRQAKESRRAY